MKNKFIKSAVLCIVLAIVGFVFSGCSNISSTDSTQDRYYATFNRFKNDQKTAQNSQEYLSEILFGENGQLTVTSATAFYNNTGTSVAFKCSTDAFDTPISFTYNNDNYTIQPIVNKKTKEIEYLKIFKNGTETQDMSWDS